MDITLTKTQKVLATLAPVDINGAAATVNEIVWTSSDFALIDFVEVVGNPHQKTLVTKGIEGVCTVTVTARGKDGAPLSAFSTITVGPGGGPSEATSMSIAFGTPEEM